ncbi:MAG: hypothetical protein SVX43_22255 [Cyanobacteriota bacterium]|nr:hypothetical protein [Cyanobacteriota bacterium]
MKLRGKQLSLPIDLPPAPPKENPQRVKSARRKSPRKKGRDCDERYAAAVAEAKRRLPHFPFGTIVKRRSRRGLVVGRAKSPGVQQLWVLWESWGPLQGFTTGKTGEEEKSAWERNEEGSWEKVFFFEKDFSISYPIYQNPLAGDFEIIKIETLPRVGRIAKSGQSLTLVTNSQIPNPPPELYPPAQEQTQRQRRCNCTPQVEEDEEVVVIRWQTISVPVGNCVFVGGTHVFTSSRKTVRVMATGSGRCLWFQ